KNDITVGLGTDGAASNNVLDMFEEMRFASFMQKVYTKNPLALPAYETLKMGTFAGAEALGLENEEGSIEVDKKADITLIDMDALHHIQIHDVISHLIYSVKAQDVSHTIVNGEVLLDNGKLTTIDLEEVNWHIAKIKTRLFGEMNK